MGRTASDYSKLLAHDRGLILVAGRMVGVGAGVPTIVVDANSKDIAHGFTIARSALGKYNVTTKDRFYQIHHAQAWLSKTTVDGLAQAHNGPFTIQAADQLANFAFELRRSMGVAATLSPAITCTLQANYVDTETHTITDEYGNATLFEFDPAGDGAAGAGVAVDISGDTTAADVAATFAPLITANCPWLTVVDNLDGTIDLTHKRPGAAGNAVVQAETVANAGHVIVTPLAGGIDAGALLDLAAAEFIDFQMLVKRTSGTRV